jgi:HEAT repeat protein
VAFQIRDKLVALLSHPEAIVRLSAARNLLEIGMKHESVLPTLEELISDPDIALIDTAIDMMAEGGKKLAELVDDARKL